MVFVGRPRRPRREPAFDRLQIESGHPELAGGAAAAGTTKDVKAPDAKAAPAAPAPAAEKVNATHPSREGRGAGNLRDAIARQRKQATTRSTAPRARSKGK